MEQQTGGLQDIEHVLDALTGGEAKEYGKSSSYSRKLT